MYICKDSCLCCVSLYVQGLSFGLNFGSSLLWNNYFNRTHGIEIAIFKQLPHPRNCTKGFVRVIESTSNIPRDGKDLPFLDKEARQEEIKLLA